MKKLLYSLFFVMIVTFSTAQDSIQNKSQASMNGTLDKQFDYVVQKSNNFQEYKVVKRDFLTILKRNSLDSVNRFKTELADLKAEFTKHTTTIQQLKDTLKTTQVELDKLKIAQDNVSFLGTPVSKANYNMIMWGIVSVLLLILVVFLFQLKGAKSIANDAKHNLDKLEDDFEEYKRKALEKEQKLGRQLQDEINKQKKSSK
ncbi:tRNA (guanine-N1)-methyltransferase [Flavobacterium piscinae]|uniref:tRNA (Guanine-N1)-methyltransferase n=1 Tax=Flavobacterium piscinae TaxID=2506424 RepID=A0A4Q1KYE9_9FLAO|nr:tRNA (guanine-N1)-methyltransferase [Flavobacterium piscinae]MBC8883851.1 tRNA (guanine-N1)-methyltransferase [Flavobacterium piscinae]RXR35403.1 tRNA (guanine-N1)-methyltransferase [Flavobacterium piscinae]